MTLTELETVSRAFLTLALETTLRSFALACVCAGIAWMLRSRTAFLRFSLWKWTLLGLLALPLLIRLTPALPPASRTLARAEAVITIAATPPAKAAIAKNSASIPHPLHLQLWSIALFILYVAATVVLLARLALSLVHLGRLAVRSQIIRDPVFQEISHELWLNSGALSKPHFAVSNNIAAPVTFESGNTWILFPPSWSRWENAKLRAVLTHELAHVQRGDSQNLLLASIATCLFWFHPLSWFLRSRLAATAEEACDEVVVAYEAAPEEYANFLIDFARDVKRGRGRIAAGAIAVAGTSSLKSRIERLFEDTRHRQQGRKAFALLSLALFAPALYLAAAARPFQPQDNSQPSTPIWPDWTQVQLLSPNDAAKLESDVRANPEDLQARMELLAYLGTRKQDQAFTQHLLWFIHHHPSLETLPMTHLWLSSDSAAQIAAAWENAIAEHPDSLTVLYNAAEFIQAIDSERALELLREVKTSGIDQTKRYIGGIETIYAAAEMQFIDPTEHLNNIRIPDETAAKLREELQSSHDPALLCGVGTLLVKLRPPHPGFEDQFKHGLELIQQAINLDPHNPEWTEALQSAQSEPQRQLNYETLLKR